MPVPLCRALCAAWSARASRGALYAALALLAGVTFGALAVSTVHAAPFTFEATDAASSITIADRAAAEGDTICALDNLSAGDGLIDTTDAACASVAADGSWSLEVDTDDFDGDAFLVLADGSASSTPVDLANGSVSFDDVSDLALLAAAADVEGVLLLTLAPLEAELTGTVRLRAYVFGPAGALGDQQVTFSFEGPGSPSNAIPIPTNSDGLADITVFAGDVGTVAATATLTPIAALTIEYSVVEPPEPDPLPDLQPGFNAWLGRNATASEIVQPGQILWKWTGNAWISFAQIRMGFQLGEDFPLILGDVLFLGRQS